MNKEDPKGMEVMRIIDANLNRLREALRVIEEYCRFLQGKETESITLKQIRHTIEIMERECTGTALLNARDTATDPFAHSTRPEELTRTSVEDIVSANFKRSQEACRVLEEYGKILGNDQIPMEAKRMRFTLYTLEKQIIIP